MTVGHSIDYPEKAQPIDKYRTEYWDGFMSGVTVCTCLAIAILAIMAIVKII